MAELLIKICLILLASVISHAVIKRFVLASLLVAILSGLMGAGYTLSMAMAMQSPGPSGLSMTHPVVVKAGAMIFATFAMVGFYFACLVGYPILWHRKKTRLLSHCAQCDYNLTGNASGVCPECGEPVR